MRASAFLCITFALFQLISAHSWVQCTDYRVENGSLWDANQCKGWPRNYRNAFKYTQPPYLFGGDAGFEFRPGTGNVACQTTTSANPSDWYDTTYPAATYAPGQKVCLSWPSKNHVADTCNNNPNIRDGGVKVYRSGLNPTADPTFSEFKQNLVADLGAASGLDHGGFQNCPNFCPNQDKALCGQCFTVPTGLAPGKYTFLWAWIFNPSELYNTCFDVTISGTSSANVATANTATGTTATGTSSANTATATTASSSSSSTNTGSQTSGALCNVGAEGCSCTAGGGCDKGLSCLSQTCVDAKSVQSSAGSFVKINGVALCVVALFSLVLAL